MSTKPLSEGDMIPGTSYRVLRLLGSGGMGSVYEVEHLELGKRFVLKTLLRELSTRADLVQRLRTEWRALGKLEHPNIVRVSDAGVAEGTLPYFVMERLTGETLADRLSSKGKLSIEQSLKVAIGVLDALAVAHNIGIIHRDVKPPNIFVTTQGVTKLLDFGIAKLLDASTEGITARGVAVGTPRYMSPEQAAGDPVDHRADLYAVGLVLYEMITGRGPYQAADANELFLAHLTQAAPPLSSRVPGVRLELESVVASLLAKAPGERPPSAKAAADALRAVLELVQRPNTTAQGPSSHFAASRLQVMARGEASVAAAPPTVPLRDAPEPSAIRPEVGRSERPRRPERLGEATQPVDPKSLQPTELQAASFGNTVRVEDHRAQSSVGSPTRTQARPAGTPSKEKNELGGTPPPVSSGAFHSEARIKRWVFPVLVIVGAGLALALAWPRGDAAPVKPEQRAASAPVPATESTVAAPSTPPALAPTVVEPPSSPAPVATEAPIVSRPTVPSAGPGTRVAKDPPKLVVEREEPPSPRPVGSDPWDNDEPVMPPVRTKPKENTSKPAAPPKPILPPSGL